MIHIISGAPCSGKTTYVQQHRKDGDIVIDADALASAFGSKTGHFAKGEILNVALRARESAIDEAIKSNVDCWIIDSYPKKERYGVDADFVVLDPSIEECERRAAQDKRPEGTISAIRKWYEYAKKGNKMDEPFKVIETQEQFDAAIKDRLNRQNEKHSKELSELTAKYSDYDSLKTKVTDYEAKISALETAAQTHDSKVKELEKAISEKDAKIAAQATAALKAGIAREFNIPDEIATRINGTTEEEIRKDAEKLSKAFGNRAPLFNPEPPQNTDGDKADFKKMLQELNLRKE